MNKSDVKLITIGLLLSIGLLILFNISNKNISKIAIVYYEDKIIKKIDLAIDNEYKVTGYNGDVMIEVKKGKIRVKKEKSPLHICSYQGFSNSSYQPIVCLPNKIVIKIVNNKDAKIDAIVR